MRFRLLTLAFVVAGCSGAPAAERGALGEEGAPIISGQVTTGYPSAVFLSMECTGTLISPRVVLTAKHCTEGSTAGNVQAYVTNTAYEGYPIQVTKIAQHNQTDISLLALASAAGVMPTPVFGGVQGSLEAHVGEPVTYVGFGASNNNPPPNDGFGTKQSGSSPLDHLQGDGLLTGYDMNASWHCFGDSGGPAFMNMNGVEQLVGVISAGAADQCGVPGDLSIRTDSYYEWIANLAEEVDGPPACTKDGRCQDTCADEDPDCSGSATQPPPPPPPNCTSDGTCESACESDPDCASGPPIEDECGRDGVCRCQGDPDCPSKPKANASNASVADGESDVGGCSVRAARLGDVQAWLTLALAAFGAFWVRVRRCRRHPALGLDSTGAPAPALERFSRRRATALAVRARDVG